MQTLQVDPEFRDEMPPLLPGEKQLLEDAILADGCRDPLVVWDEKNIIVDGHNRYEICTKHNIPFDIVSKSFESRLHALVWMHQNQGGRRNISKYYKDKQALRMVERLEELGKQNMSKGGGDKISEAVKAGSPVRENPVREDEKVDAWEIAAQTYDTSRTSMSRTKDIEQHAPEAIKEAVANGDISRTKGAELAKAINKLPEEFRAVAAALCSDEIKKAACVIRLHKSMGHPHTNGTFMEIVTTGGFHYGDNLEHWCDFKNDTIEQIEAGLESLKHHHIREAMITRRAERQAARVTTWQGPGWSGIICGDMRQVGPDIPDDSIDLIFTDPPYLAEFMPLYSDLAALAARVLKPSGVCMAYTGQIHLPEAIARMSEYLEYAWTCAIRHTGGFTRMWKVNLNVGWKPVLMFVKPPLDAYWDNLLDTVSGGREKDDHEWQQSEAEAAHFIKALCPEGGVVLDPFAGSGTTLAAAKKLGLGYIGIEIDTDHADSIKDRLDDTQTL